ncbi:MAG: Protein OS-9 [Piccolia ochrophora]|nr:MAG: Protein OS-9 [Piccolia ochrophora]
MRLDLAVLLWAPVALASRHIFSVHDDVLAFPQYDVVFSDSFISEEDAHFLTTNDVSESESSAGGPSHQATSETRHKDDSNGKHEEPKPTETYEVMHLGDRRFLCAIPIVEPSPRNETAEAMARAEEEKELARATGRGWDLLKDLEGKCMYLTTGWWSYEFCYNHEVKQYHSQPPQKGAQSYPPREDSSTPSYVLGRALRRAELDPEPRKEISDGRNGLESAELQVKGEMRYLVQKLSDGTICDLTGRERRIEIQFHCHPQSTDRIGWIKELTTCAYQMVVYTPRLCEDVAFLPPRENSAHPIACREVVEPSDISAWESHVAADAAQNLLLQGAPETAVPEPDVPRQTFVVGGIEVGATKQVGGEGQQRIEPIIAGSGTQQVEVIASRTSSQRGDAEGDNPLTDAELKKLRLKSADLEKLKEQLRNVPLDRGWSVQIIDGQGDERSVLIVVDPDPNGEEESDADEEDRVRDQQDENDEAGSQEEYREEL